MKKARLLLTAPALALLLFSGCIRQYDDFTGAQDAPRQEEVVDVVTGDGSGEVSLSDVPGRGDADLAPTDTAESTDPKDIVDTVEPPTDTPTDTLTDIIEPDETASPQDTTPPLDMMPPKDTPSPEDTSLSDMGPCGGCPPDNPNCVGGICKCTPFSCIGGTYCFGGQCVPCTLDAHCGPDCQSCPSLGQFCAADGTHCIVCDATHVCPQGEKCEDEVCVDCAALGLCGPDCLTCGGSIPICVDGGCACSEESCPSQHVCEEGACVACTQVDPAHCGPSCLVCDGATPHCQDGACVFCGGVGACGSSCQPCGGALPHCAPDGSGCVQCLGDEQCSPEEHCTGSYTCGADCTSDGCATDTSPGGDSCMDAVIIGRLDATDGGAVFSGDTTGASNDDDLAQGWFPPANCNDEGEDRFYRIHMVPGDTLSVQVGVGSAYFDAMLKLYTGTECDEDDAGIFEDNDADLLECWNESGAGESESFIWVADAEGWYTIVIDGRDEYDPDAGPDHGDYGPYEITISLTCSEDGCCCL